MNFIEREEAIDVLWQRDLSPRQRVGLQPNHDIREAVRPKGMVQTVDDALRAEIDVATIGFLEGLADLWGHSIGHDTDAGAFVVLGKAKPTLVRRGGAIAT